MPLTALLVSCTLSEVDDSAPTGGIPMHRIHLEYAKAGSHNTLSQLFEVIDRLDPKKRDAAMMVAFMQFVNLEQDRNAGPHDRIGDTMTDFANYNRFKEECGKLPKSLSEA